eukprot:scaffold184_cov379-Prasinococcus_capsulatus_cf.AAC.19
MILPPDFGVDAMNGQRPSRKNMACAGHSPGDCVETALRAPKESTAAVASVSRGLSPAHHA